jgi:hypothetical protein
MLPVMNEMIIKNIRNFAGSKAIEHRLDNGRIAFACYLPEMTVYDINTNRYHINFGKVGLKRNGNLLGLAGFFYDSDRYFAATPQKVIDAWNWFNKETQSTDDYWQAIEAETVWNFFRYNWSPFNFEFREGYIANIISLINDLHTLDLLGINVNEKLLEIKNEKLKGNMEAFQRLSNNEAFHVNNMVTKNAFLRIRKVSQELANLSSETRLALFSTRRGFKVALSKSPDLLIEGKRIEVKSPKVLFNNPRKQAERINGVLVLNEENCRIENLTNSIRKGFNQGANIVAIEVNHLDRRRISGYSTKWLGGIIPLEKALRNSLSYQKKGTVMLFRCRKDEGYTGRVLRCKANS